MKLGIFIKKLKKKANLRKYVENPDELSKIIDKNRFKTGKPNYSAIGRELGCNHETAKRLITELRLLDSEPTS